MKQLLYIILLTVISGCLLITGCKNDEFSTNPSDFLNFSTDTVSFDTIFTTIGSSTQKLMIYNKNKKALNIESIELAGKGNSVFYINIDGIKGTLFQNVEIDANDSLFSFIEVNVNPTLQNSPILIEDSLIFRTNGVRQSVKLIAYGQDVIIWRGKVIKSDTIINHVKPFLIYDSLSVNTNTSLKINEGVRFYFHDKAKLLIKGNLQCKGSLDQPIIMRGDRLDNLFDNLPYDYLAGQWGGIRFYDSSLNNLIEYTQIRNMSWGMQIDSSTVDTEKLCLRNCKISNSNGKLFLSVNSMIDAANCEFSTANDAVVELIGGSYRFTHCTIANYFSWNTIKSPTLVLSNYDLGLKDAIIAYPLKRAEFNNCVIAGKLITNLSLNNEYNKTPVNAEFNHLFTNCLIKSNEIDDQNFIFTIWNKDPKFINTGVNYQYDFRPGASSPLIDMGDIRFAREFPYDLLGHYRLNDKAPDIGAYEWEGE